jgi:uncharacterized glyoxalase superfamily protein PhnB
MNGFEGEEESSFFSPRFAMLRDKFGTSWMIVA